MKRFLATLLICAALLPVALKPQKQIVTPDKSFNGVIVYSAASSEDNDNEKTQTD